MIKRIQTPLKYETIKKLKSGDIAEITGYLYTARDAAHKRLIELIKNSLPMLFDIKDAIIYYVGPTPNQPNKVIGSAGPTTSCRMDQFTSLLLEMGLKGMIGKGIRGDEIKEEIVKHKAIYFASIGGAGALLSRHIKSSEIIRWKDLGTEAIRRIFVKDFPVIVINDIYGGDLYNEGRGKYEQK